MLYFGWCFFMKEASRSRASASVSVMMYLMLAIFESIINLSGCILPFF